MTELDQIEKCKAAADSCMAPEQREAFDRLGDLDPCVFSRLYRAILTEAAKDD